jgi:osmotically-inducible protein OsmY
VTEDPYYLEARIARRLAEDPDTAELGVKVAVHGGTVFLSGAVASDERRAHVVETARAESGGLPVTDDLVVSGTRPPERPEELT